METTAIAGASEAPLEELMVAMDVVDTVRHRQLIVKRELDAVGRRERLVERLREIYTAQGIEVTDSALQAGVDALEEERFSYTPSGGGLATALAKLYIRRRFWLKPLLAVLAIGLLIAGAWYVTVQLPETRLRAALPAQIEAIHRQIVGQSQSETATTNANDLLAQGRLAIDNESFGRATDVRDELQALLRELELGYEIRIVSRPNELSGVWRVPDINPDARNYYLIVEAVDTSGNVLDRRIRNEESGRLETVRKWGVRVDQEIFEAVAADKRDDGIVSDYLLGSKRPGHLDADYRVPVSGATITDW